MRNRIRRVFRAQVHEALLSRSNALGELGGKLSLVIRVHGKGLTSKNGTNVASLTNATKPNDASEANNPNSATKQLSLEGDSLANHLKEQLASILLKLPEKLRDYQQVESLPSSDRRGLSGAASHSLPGAKRELNRSDDNLASPGQLL